MNAGTYEFASLNEQALVQVQQLETDLDAVILAMSKETTALPPQKLCPSMAALHEHDLKRVQTLEQQTRTLLLVCKGEC
ncbi:Uncharacterised protein [BD1-7 clade bacterium]|uniref:Uncharacterized protein n=1 Tax=BD1-7 clade bacterium TaxID=2029982 RepID=A0A5S9PHE2_9GAMM|nr:Uncharacterised protein [BD1-7 clade bacterium]CAA0103555.1 Uncharacterised protein [BD1-7 clade bacterium]